MNSLNFIKNLYLLNKLGKVDKTFFLILIIIIAVCVGLYFLMPVINHKQYQQQRDNLKLREETFKQNLRSQSQPNITIIEEDKPAEESNGESSETEENKLNNE